MRTTVPPPAAPSRLIAQALALLAAAGTLLVAACTASQVRYEVEPPTAPTGNPQAVLYLVGDAGEVNPARDDVLAHLRANIDSVAGLASPPAVVVTFLGDNIYDEGLPAEPSEEDLEKLRGQVLAVGEHEGVRGVFLPGNHDWANGASIPDGRAAIRRQSEWIERVTPGRDIRFLPDDGCPGPASVDIGESVRLVFIDTEWLLRKPEQRCGTAAAFYGRLADALRAAGERRVIILAHHPLVSGGPHGGNVAPLERGPFVYYLARKTGAAVQDLSSRRYAGVIEEIRRAIAASGVRPLAIASGHDHNLQVIRMAGPENPSYQLVSGAGSKTERAMRIPGMRFATDGYGYMRLAFREDGVALTVYARGVEGGPVRPMFGCSLTGAEGGCPEAPLVDESP